MYSYLHVHVVTPVHLEIIVIIIYIHAGILLLDHVHLCCLVGVDPPALNLWLV